MNDRNDLPPPTSGNFLARVREELTIMMGNRGTPLDQAVRFKDLQNSSLLRLDAGFLAGHASNRPTIAGTGPALAASIVYLADLTPPPTPTGFTASAIISNLLVQTDAAVFTMGHGYQRTVLYGASRTSLATPAPTYANAIELTQFIGTVAAYPTNPSTIWHLWVKWMTVDGVLSVSPAGGINGFSVTTGQDVQLLINALTGQITASQLYSDLGARINLIDGTGAGSVNNRVALEASARAQAILDEVAARGTAITNESQTRTTADSALATQISTLSSTVETNKGVSSAAIQNEATARSNAVTAEADLRSTLAARVTTTEGSISTNSAAITNESATRSSADGGLATRIDTVQSTATTDRGVSAAAVSSEVTARTSAVSALSSRVDTVQATATTDRGTAASAITSEQTARSNADGSLGSRIDTVQATATTDRGIFTSAISTEQTARASADGTLFAQYSVKVDTNGYVSGFGLSSTANNATPTSAFAVRADQFYIASPSGPGIAPLTPFIVRTTATTINGVSVPAGVYMQDAFIANGTISNAKIGNAQIDDAKIANLNVSKLTAGVINTGDITSTGRTVVNGVSMPSWSINGSSGLATFNNVVVRGTVYASAGSFSGDISASTGNFRGQITGGAYTGYNWPPAGSGGGFFLGFNGLLLGNYNDGKYFQATNTGDIYTPQFNIVNGAASFSGSLNAASGSFAGSLSAATGSFSGSLNAATGSFSGSLNAASGSFSGSLTASAVNAVRTVNIAGSSVSTTSSSSSAGSYCAVALYIPPGEVMRIIVFGVTGGYFDSSPSSSTVTAYINGSAVATSTQRALPSNDLNGVVYNGLPQGTVIGSADINGGGGGGGGGLNVLVEVSGNGNGTKVVAFGALR